TARFSAPPSSTLFPYTTLFRSVRRRRAARRNRLDGDGDRPRVAGVEGVGVEIGASALEQERVIGHRLPDPGIEETESRAVEDSRSEEHTSELQSRFDLVCRLLL